MQDQDRVGISDAMSNELYSKLMLNQRPDIRDSRPDISYDSSSLVLQQHVRTGSAPPQLDNMSGSPFFAEGGTKGAFFGNGPAGASQMGYDTAGFRSNVSDDRKHAGTVDTAKLLHHKMKPVDARGMPMSASGGDVRSQLWLNKAAAEGKSWAQQDTDDRDVPLSAGTSPGPYMLHAGLQPSIGQDSIAGSCPAPSSHLDAELPYFSGKSIRTHPNLASLQAVSRAGSAYGGPSSATSMLAAETPFTQGDGLFHASSPLVTPRSPLFDMNATAMAGNNGMLDVQGTSNMPAKDILCGMGDVLQGRPDNRYKPSKLRNMSSEYDHPVSTAALLAAGASSMMVNPPAMDTFGLAAEASGQTSTSSSTGLLEAAAMVQQQQQQQEQQQQAAAMASFAAAAAAAGMYPPGGMPAPGMPGMQPMMGMAGAQLPGMPGTPPGLPPLPPDPTGAVNPYAAMQMAWWQAMTNLLPQMFMGFGGYPPYGPMPGGDPSGMPGMPPGLPPFSNPAEYAACMQRMMAAAASHGPWGNPASFMAMAAAAASAGGGGPGSHMDERDVMGAGLRGGDRRRSDNRMGRRCEDPCSLLRPNRLLEQFKETKDSSHWAMRDVLGHMLDFSLDQHGSRFIQQHLGELTQAELSIAFHELLPKALTLMNDVFGNYVIQKVLDLGPGAHRSELMLQMRGQVLHLSLQMYSCRVIQKALEVVSLKEKVEMVGELEGHVLRCVRDQNGNHVVQKIIECVPTRHIGHLLDAVIGQLVPLAVHSFGCRVVQRILEHCDDPARHEVVMREILGATVQLTQDQYGNYVIQHVLEHGTNAERTAIISQLAPHIVALSQNKFASNVVEKCLLHGSPQQRVALVEGILNSPGPRAHPPTESSSSSASGEGSGAEADGPADAAAAAAAAEDAEADPLYKMMKDQFGNYVVQKVLEVCNDDQRERLLARVRAQLWSLKKYTYGKHIVTRVEKLLSAGTRIQTGQQRYNAMNVGVIITPDSSSTSIGMPASGWQAGGPSPQQQQDAAAEGMPADAAAALALPEVTAPQ